MAGVTAAVNGQNRVWPGAALLLGLTLLAYLPALRGGFIWDDNDYVTGNATLRDAAGLGAIWTDIHANWQYYPLVFSSFWVEFQAWGLHPLGYHLDNILLHGVSAVLLWRLLLRLEFAPAACWLAGAVFAVHPVEVESVAWVTERKNVLCGVFYLSAMLVYFAPRRTRATYLAAAGLFLCAMLSKTVAATWPAAVLVIEWWRRGRVNWRDMLGMAPFVVIGLVLGLLTSWIEIGQVGAGGADWDFTFADRCIIAGRAVWFYAVSAIAPVQLTFIYPRWNLYGDRNWVACPAEAVAVVYLLIFIFTWRIGRGPAAIALLFAITLFPALGFVDYYPMRYSFVADHFQYLAIIALIVPIAVLAVRWAGKGALLLLIPLMILTFRQSMIYHDPVALWSDTVAKNPGSWMVHENLGQAWEDRRDLDRAEQEYVTATAFAEADPWWKLGEFRANRGDYGEARKDFLRALAIDPDNKIARDDLARLQGMGGAGNSP